MIRNILNQSDIRTNIIGIIIAVVISAVVILATIVQPYAEPHILLRDSNTNFLKGLVSNIGIIILISTSAILWFCSIVCSKISALPCNKILGISAFFFTLMSLDDFFMLHDRILPKIFGIPEEVLYMLYVILALTLCVLYWRGKNFKHLPILFCAFGALALSMMSDIFGLGYVVEDGFKFLGYVLCLISFSLYGYDSIQRSFKHKNIN